MPTTIDELARDIVRPNYNQAETVAQLARAILALRGLPDAVARTDGGPYQATRPEDGVYIRAQLGPVTATWHGGGYADLRIGSGSCVDVLNLDGNHEFRDGVTDEHRAQLCAALEAWVRDDERDPADLEEYARQGFPRWATAPAMRVVARWG